MLSVTSVGAFPFPLRKTALVHSSEMAMLVFSWEHLSLLQAYEIDRDED